MTQWLDVLKKSGKPPKSSKALVFFYEGILCLKFINLKKHPFWATMILLG